VSNSVLIVEDDALSLKLTRDVLQSRGFETKEAGDGLEALRIAASLDTDLIVMDIGLPGMDGVEVTRRLKLDARTAPIPVIAVTALAMPEDEQRMRQAGCDALLTKPVRLQELVDVVENLIASRKAPHP
jgi:two-component system cell cycle response regulator DivK